jgi:hypothetical protein
MSASGLTTWRGWHILQVQKPISAQMKLRHGGTGNDNHTPRIGATSAPHGAGRYARPCKGSLRFGAFVVAVSGVAKLVGPVERQRSLDRAGSSRSGRVSASQLDREWDGPERLIRSQLGASRFALAGTTSSGRLTHRAARRKAAMVAT